MESIGLSLFFIAIGLFGMFFSGHTSGENDIKKEAQERGYMHYVVDQKDGKSKLEWK